MADIDLAEAVGAAVLHGNRTGGHLRNVSPGVVVIDYEAILEAALPSIREQLAQQIEAKANTRWREPEEVGLELAARIVRGGDPT